MWKCAFLLLACSFGVSAPAVTLPAAAFSAIGTLDPARNVPEFVGLTPGAYAAGNCDTQSTPQFCLSTTIDTSSKLTLSLREAVQPFGTSNIQTTAEYYYEVAGTPTFAGDFGVLVSYVVQYSIAGDVSQLSRYSVQAAVSSTQDGTGPVGRMASCSESTVCSPTALSGSFVAIVAANTPFRITLIANAQMVASAADPDVVITALADPVISFAPGYDTTGLSIVVSNGIPNGVAPVPEPAPATLLAGGLCALALWRRRSPPSATDPRH